MLEIGGNNIRITGIVTEGEMFPNSASPLTSEGNYMRGIRNWYGYTGMVVDNCELRGWAYSAIEVKDVPTAGRPWIHHNYIHYNLARGEGYGTEVYGGDVLIEGNLYDENRHSITGTGADGEKYTVRYNIFLNGGDNVIGGFAVDVHENIDGVSSNAGNTFYIHHNTIYDTGDTEQMPFVHITCDPDVGAYIYNNDIQVNWGGTWQSATSGLTIPNWQGQRGVIVQTTDRGSSNVRVFATNNQWRGSIYDDNTGLVWLQG